MFFDESKRERKIMRKMGNVMLWGILLIKKENKIKNKSNQLGLCIEVINM